MQKSTKTYIKGLGFSKARPFFLLKGETDHGTIAGSILTILFFIYVVYMVQSESIGFIMRSQYSLGNVKLFLTDD